MAIFHLLISLLTAIQNYAKDIHYTVKGQAAYSKHLFADLLQDDLYDYVDDIKENIFLGSGVAPASSKFYLEAAAEMVPNITVVDTVNFMQMLGLVNKTRMLLKGIEGPTRGANALIDNIGETLDKSAGLLFIQIRQGGCCESIDESKDFSVEHCEAATEKAIDRAKGKLAKIDYPEVEKTVKRQEAENVMVAEESALDRVGRKLGV